MKHSTKTKFLCFLMEKSKYFKVISMILVLALMVQTVSIAVTAITESDLLNAETASIDDSSETMPSIVGEVESSRDRYTKVYELADGSFYEIVSNDPIHKNVDGHWEEPVNNMDMPESVDEVVSYCNELVDSISEEQNDGGISTLSYIEDDAEPSLLNNAYDDVYVVNYYDEYQSEFPILDTDTRLLLRIDDERLFLSNSNQLLLNQMLYIDCKEPDIAEEDAELSVQVISQEWYIDEDKKLTVYDSNSSPVSISGSQLQVEGGLIGTAVISSNEDVTCEFDITEICHRWYKGIVENNGLFISISGDLPSTEIKDCYLTRRYLIIDAYDQDFTYHTMDMGYAGQVLINDLTNTITVLRNEIYYPTGTMPINLYRYFDFSKTYMDLNPAGNGSHWNYECFLMAETQERVAWSAFDGQTIRFKPSDTDSNEWYAENGEEYTLNISASNITSENYNGVTIESPDGLTYTFGVAGKLIRIDDGNSNYIAVYYNNETTQDYIVSIENNSGYRYLFGYEEIYDDKLALTQIQYQKKSDNEIYNDVSIDDVNIIMKYEYILLPDGNIALSKVTYPYDSETPESDQLTVEYLYDNNGRLVGIVDIDKRKLEIDYTYKPDENTVLDNYPSAFSFKEYVFNKAYTNDMPDDQMYLSVPKSSFIIDRQNTYHRTFINELEEKENLHYSKEFQLLYYTNNNEDDYYADYKFENDKHYVSQIVSPEKDPILNIENEDFETSQGESFTNWSGRGLTRGDGVLNEQGQYCAKITGSISGSRYVAQKATINGQAGDIFVVGGYALSKNSVSNEKQLFGIEVYKIEIADNGKESVGELLYNLAFDPTMNNKVQFRLGAFKLTENIEKVYYKIVYSYQTGEAYFDDVLLYKSSGSVDFFNAPVTGDDNDYTSSISTPSTSSDSNNNNIQVDVLSDGTNQMISKYEYSSDANYLMKHIDNNNIATNFEYDDYTGLLTKKSVETGENSSDIVDKYSYDAMGTLKMVSRVVGSIENATDPENTSDIENTTKYEYEYGKISSVVHNNMTYQFNYNSYGNLENIVVNPNSNNKVTMISYDYTSDEYRNVNKITYSNGKVLEYRYCDDNHRISSIYDISDSSSKQLFSYTYDQNGNITEIKDYTSRRIMIYSDNLIGVYEMSASSDNIDDAVLLYQKQITESNSENISVLSFNYSETPNTPIYNSESKTTSYSSAITMNDDYSITFESQAVCDYFGRIKSSSVNYTNESGLETRSIVNESSYKEYSTQLDNTTTTATTNLLNTYTSTTSSENSDSNTELTQFISTYEYDSAGRITHVTYEDNVSLEPKTAFFYEYDNAGQLIKEADILGKTYTEYKYDNFGNITEKTIYSGISFDEISKTVNTTEATSKTIQFEYLESHNDVIEKIHFDEHGYKYIDIDLYGNPEDYYRLVDGNVEEFELTWSGNQLQSVRPKDDDIIYEYTYDYEGRRIQKTYYSNYTDAYPEERELVMKTDYIWDDNILVGYKIYFGDLGTPVTIEAVILYDELNDPIGLKYSMDGLTDSNEELDFAEEDIFWFIKDGQGNVKAIYSEETNYTIGCNYTNGQLSIDFTDSFVKALDEKLSEIEDNQEVWRVFFAYAITLQQAPLISMDASHATPHSYIFDTETGLYYYQNKYYSPEYCRFINVGNVEEIAYDLENPFNSNPFIYYNNDPINRQETLLKSKSSSAAVGIQAELSKSIFSFSDSVGIEFIYDPVKDELYAYYYSDAKSNIDYTQKAIEHIKNVLGSIPFSAATSLNGLASNFKINNSLSLSYFSVQHDKSFVWPYSYVGTTRVVSNKTNKYRGYKAYGSGYQSKGVCYYPTTNIGFVFNDLNVKYTKLEVNFPELKNYLSANYNNIIATTK